MKPVRIRRRWKVLAAGLLAVAGIAVSFNIWFVQNTNAIIESLVLARSNGHIQLQLERSTFQYFRKKIVLYGATFNATDTSGARTTYQFAVPKLDLKMRSFWAFLVNRELLIDSINLRQPNVTVTRLSKAEKEETTSLSVPEEIGRIYNSILDALQVLQVKRFQIQDGRFNLVNKLGPQQQVTTISNIHFNLNNLVINSDRTAAEKFFYSDNVILQVNNQDITLPDGIHHISFKNLLINVGRRQVKLDSCWVKAETASDRNAFRIFFDALNMTNLDFAALYRKNLIKADSVYITNPDINLALEVKHRRERTKKLELDTIIQRFTGDLNLGFIGVQNATVNIVANRGDTTTTFRSTNDNFKMFGLRINSDSAKPVFVDEFAMILREYETYSRDSSAVYRFDSLRFNNNKVRLSNFTIRSIGSNTSKGTLNYSIPAFELTGLSWEDLLFDRYINAEKAVLLNPNIQYSVGSSRRKGGSASLFRLLSGLNETINLNAVEIRDGNLNVLLPAGKQLRLQHVNLALSSNKLLASTSYTGMKDAIKELGFQDATFTTGNFKAELHNLRYTDRLHADALRLTSTDNSFTAMAKGITMNDLVWNNQEKSVFADHLMWQQGSFILRTGFATSKAKAINASIVLNKFTGYNTNVTIYAKNSVLKTTVAKLSFDNLLKKGAAAVAVTGILANGKNLDLKTPAFQLQTGGYHFADGKNSEIAAVWLLQQSLTDTTNVQVPHVGFTSRFADLQQGKFNFSKLALSNPIIELTRNKKETATIANAHWPQFKIELLTFTSPTLRYTQHDTATTLFSTTDVGRGIPVWTFEKVYADAQKKTLTAGNANLELNQLLFTKRSKTVGIDTGLAKISLKEISFSQTATLEWTAFLQTALFQNPIPLVLSNNARIELAAAQVENLQLTSNTVTKIFPLLQANQALQLQLTNGEYAGEKTTMQWRNVSYRQANQSVQVDSFKFHPNLSRDSAIALAAGQFDYMHGLLKKMQLTHIDLPKWEKDHTLKAQRLVATEPELHLYRDKQKPFISAGLRLLPVLALQQLPLPLSIDTVALRQATINYTERSDKTGQEGSVSINRINADLFPVRNFEMNAKDSLTLVASGYLMDSALLRLRVKEAYTDSLGTFAMTLRVQRTPLSILNPVLMPLASVKVISGDLDTLFMRAIGHDYFSIGDMRMYYKNLKLQFLKNGSEAKKTFLTGLITFAANNFVIRQHNNRNTGTVYFLRSRDRSVFHFLIKSALSGVASSIGAKKNKTYNRQYKKQQKLYKLPPVDLG